MITQLSIENFKCFSSKQTFRLSNMNILAGMNGRGKSTIFQALLLLAQSLQKTGNIETLCVNGDFVRLSHFQDLISSDLKNKGQGIVRFEIDTDQEDYRNICLGYEAKNEWCGKICELKISDKDYFTSTGSIGTEEEQLNTERFLQSTYPRMDKVFSPFYFISASRLGPTLYEEKCEEEEFNPLGILGERRLAVLVAHSSLNGIRLKDGKSASLIEEVNKWCDYIMGGSELDLVKTDNTLQLRMKNRHSMGWAKSINMGFGYSYILSIIIVALIAERGSVVFVENPEAHLHPSAQARLMELLSLLAMNGVQVNIETHSEHILNSVRLYCLQEEKSVTQDHVSIYFFDEEFRVYPLNIDSNGQIANWPKGFFDLQEQQLLEILQLGLMKK
ncbi:MULTISPECIES: DUF3696 domain-containing protein [unclassified Butyricimonas]|uniref:AAA family ATPase n=1 Tax=unclassified Butyricimonas TaxID=2637652 RepID=UPI000C087C01|nr:MULTISPECIES: DUF3696 domain-containing protein [unclassified Butyricimonas]